jgi:drug/metabolite transporter (DMT)-like permease
VLFGASVVAVRVAVRDVPPVSLAVLRFGLGGLLLAGILPVVAPRSLRARWERLPRFALLGLVLFVLFPLTFNVGLGYTEASRVRSCWPRCRSGARSWDGSWLSA